MLVREVEKPSAPLAIASLAAVAHHVGADRAVGGEGRDVHRARLGVEYVHELVEMLPPPGQTLRESGGGDVLDTRHHTDQPVVAVRARRRETHPAIARDHRGDPVVRGGIQQGIPSHLGVEVGMGIDETRHYQPAVGLDLPRPAARHLPDFRDPIALERDVGVEGFGTRAVDHLAVPDHHVEHWLGLPIPRASHGSGRAADGRRSEAVEPAGVVPGELALLHLAQVVALGERPQGAGIDGV